MLSSLFKCSVIFWLLLILVFLAEITSHRKTRTFLLNYLKDFVAHLCNVFANTGWDKFSNRGYQVGIIYGAKFKNKSNKKIGNQRRNAPLPNHMANDRISLPWKRKSFYSRWRESVQFTLHIWKCEACTRCSVTYFVLLVFFIQPHIPIVLGLTT